MNKTRSCLICILLNGIVCAAVQPNHPQSLFSSIEETEMSFLSVRADARSKSRIMQLRETNLSAKRVLMGARLLIKQPLR